MSLRWKVMQAVLRHEAFALDMKEEQRSKSSAMEIPYFMTMGYIIFRRVVADLILVP